MPLPRARSPTAATLTTAPSRTATAAMLGKAYLARIRSRMDVRFGAALTLEVAGGGCAAPREADWLAIATADASSATQRDVERVIGLQYPLEMSRCRQRRLYNRSVTTLDHLVIAAPTLESGAAWLEDLLGVPLQAGGQHAFMRTHNRLLRLGSVYLEVIAVDPDAPAPNRPRWFELDTLRLERPRLIHWVAHTTNLERIAAHSLEDLGLVTDAARGDLRWRITIPVDGHLPLDGLVPTLIEWLGAHPISKMAESPCELVSLSGTHPQPERVQAALESIGATLTVTEGQLPALRAVISSPNGLVTLE